MASDQDRVFMELAIGQAKAAYALGEIPVGAVVVLDDRVIGQGHNRSVMDHDPSAHAEIVALRDAAQNMENYRLTNATLYVTLEPCIMCSGAALHARLRRLVFGCRDPRSGAAGTRLNLVESDFLNHKAAVEAGVLSDQCQALLDDFFAEKRS